jgi:hypothetical protein
MRRIVFAAGVVGWLLLLCIVWGLIVLVPHAEADTQVIEQCRWDPAVGQWVYQGGAWRRGTGEDPTAARSTSQP